MAALKAQILQATYSRLLPVRLPVQAAAQPGLGAVVFLLRRREYWVPRAVVADRVAGRAVGRAAFRATAGQVAFADN